MEANIMHSPPSDYQEIPRQLIIFGPPGTGKSYRAHGRTESGYWEHSYAHKLKIQSGHQIINATFHPEYTYGDFMGRLLPMSTPDGGKIIYHYRPGHFLVALAEAYKRQSSNENVLLVIDELNRGNAAAIFGSVFNLLDRGEDGWSSYPITLSDIEYEAFLRRLLPDAVEFNIAGAQIKIKSSTSFVNISECLPDVRDKIVEKQGGIECLKFKIQLPPNLYILATINTSDESIYYMDSAFKRRWDWEYMDENGEIKLANFPQLTWTDFRKNLNNFIRANGSATRRLEDKLLGPQFIKVSSTGIMNERDLTKVMFYLWDSVFTRSKSVLEKQLGNVTLATFGDFVAHTQMFVTAVQSQA